MTRRILGLAVLSLGLTACATTEYHANQKDRDGGYYDTPLDETTFAVTFLANHSSDEVTRDLLLLRCAVLTSEHGYAYFNLLGPIEGSDNQMTVTIRLSNVEDSRLNQHPAISADQVKSKPICLTPACLAFKKVKYNP